MEIAAATLPAQLYRELPAEVDRDRGIVEKTWKEILQYPPDGWSPLARRPSSNEEVGGEEKAGSAILNPSRVLGRMLCVKIDKILRDRMSAWAQVKDSEEPPSFSWILRFTEEDWKAGDVLKFVHEIAKETGGDFEKEMDNVKFYFKELLEGCDGERAELLFIEEALRFADLDLLHISAPKFHHNWDDLTLGNWEDYEITYLVGDGEVDAIFERPIDEYWAKIRDVGPDGEARKSVDMDSKFEAIGGLDDMKMAKQHWSMIVNTELEEFCERLPECNVIQAGGGHVLIETGGGKSASDKKYMAEKYLEQIGQYWVERRNWSPLLWASWDGDSTHLPRNPQMWDDVQVSSIIAALKEEWYTTQSNLVEAKRIWVPLEKRPVPERGRRYEAESNPTRTVYLDVINLGERCWEKDEDMWAAIKDERYGVPSRDRHKTINGFILSRKMTAMIESTFGMFIQSHLPREISAMGGDEIVALVEGADYLKIVQDIEDHSWAIHSTIIDERPELTWWALLWEGEEMPGAAEIKNIKNTLRDNMNTGMLSRFVNPMWSNIASETQGERRGIDDTDNGTTGIRVTAEEKMAPRVVETGRGFDVRRSLVGTVGRRKGFRLFSTLMPLGHAIFEQNEPDDQGDFDKLIRADRNMMLEINNMSERLLGFVEEEEYVGLFDVDTIRSIDLRLCQEYIHHNVRSQCWRWGSRSRSVHGQDRKLKLDWVGWKIKGDKKTYPKRYGAQKAWCRNTYGKEWYRKDKESRLREAMKDIEGILP